MRVGELAKFMIARDDVRVAKEAGKSKPWTRDPILQTYRFCNVHREDDAVTRWLRQSFYPRFAGNPDLWFAAVVARLLNLPESLEMVARYVLPYKPEQLRKTLHNRKRAKMKNFNAAYIVSTNGVAMDKVDYLIQRVLGPLWAARKNLRLPAALLTLESYHYVLMQYDGLGSFIAAQVIADLKYEPPYFDKELGIPTSQADDWYTFAASGPGSRRGLNRVYGLPVDNPWKEAQWRLCLADLCKALPSKLPFRVGNGLHAQDVQNCLCEFDKYERIRLGEGRPKQLYPGKA
jgi:hypothetical protein